MVLNQALKLASSIHPDGLAVKQLPFGPDKHQDAHSFSPKIIKDQ
jgi:hypothetical protein